MPRTVFLLLVLAGLGPVWCSRHLPTQDGASHVLNALVFRDCEDSTSPDHAFFARRLAPLPNWTATALLAGLTTFLPPLVAERVLASSYLVGLPLAVACFVGALQGDAWGASALALLLLWNRAFFLGFYNYGLSLILLFLALAFFLRRRETFGPRETAALGGLLLVSCFTHLVGFLVTAGSLLWLAAAAPGPRRRRVASVVVAAAPGVLLTLHYLASTGFFVAAAVPRAAREAFGHKAVLGPFGLLAEVPGALHRELFAVQAGSWPLGLLALAVFLWSWHSGRHDASEVGPGRRCTLALALALLLLFVVVPDHLGAHGGFLRARLAPLPFLLALATLRPVPRSLPHTLVAAAVVLLNLGLVLRHVIAVDHELDTFTAGVEMVHPGDTLVMLKPRAEPQALIDPFAAEYYCIAARAICLSNYEGATRHFPVRFRAGVKDHIKENRSGSYWADVLLGWNVQADQVPEASEPYREVYRRGSLRLWRRDKPRAL